MSLENTALDISIKIKTKALKDSKARLEYYLRMQEVWVAGRANMISKGYYNAHDTGNYVQDIKRQRAWVQSIIDESPEYFL